MTILGVLVLSSPAPCKPYMPIDEDILADLDDLLTTFNSQEVA
jgi:hypothetical protein